MEFIAQCFSHHLSIFVRNKNDAHLDELIQTETSRDDAHVD